MRNKFYLKMSMISLIVIIFFVNIFNIAKFLGESWWQGVAGIFQILAAILTIITIKQAKDLQSQAIKERMESVAPDWGYINRNEVYDLPNNDKVYHIYFHNIGLGAAKKVKVEHISKKEIAFVLENTNNQNLIETVPPEGDIYFRLVGKRDLFPSDEHIIITCISRYGQYYKWHVILSLNSKVSCEIKLED